MDNSVGRAPAVNPKVLALNPTSFNPKLLYYFHLAIYLSMNVAFGV